MEIKGNIGEEVYVKANISSIRVDESGAVYHVHIADGNEFELANVEEKNIKFSEKLRSKQCR